MTGIEITMIVSNSIEALDLYKNIFDIEIIECTNLEKGLNEAIFNLYGTKFHMLDENLEYMLIAPKEDDNKSISFNVTVENIEQTFKKVLESECTVYQEIKKIDKLNISNAIFSDKFGYIWLLHEVH